MEDIQMAEILQNTSILEKLLDENGASGKSITDKIKSFNKFNKIIPEPEDYQKYRSDKVSLKETITPEEYESLNNYHRKYKIYERNLLYGFYKKLLNVAHERNQVMHKFEYKIPNYELFQKDIQDCIQFLNNRGKQFPLKQHNNFFNRLIGTSLYQTSQSPINNKISMLIAEHNNYKNHFLCLKESEIVSLSNNNPNIEINKLFTIPSTYTYQKEKNTYFISSITNFLNNSYYAYKNIQEKIYYSFSNIIDLFSSVSSTIGNLIIGIGYLLYFPIKYWYVTLLFVTILPNTLKKDSNKKTYQSSCTYYYVSAKRLNIREENNVKSKKVGKLFKNDFVCVKKESMGWSYIEDKGWVSSKYLSDNSTD